MLKVKFLRQAGNIYELKELTKKYEGEKVFFKIEKEIALEDEEYEKFTKIILARHDFIIENKDLMYIDEEGRWHCILIKSKDRYDGILIQGDGYEKPAFAAYLNRTEIDEDDASDKEWEVECWLKEAIDEGIENDFKEYGLEFYTKAILKRRSSGIILENIDGDEFKIVVKKI
jgi:hypothetical protein